MDRKPRFAEVLRRAADACAAAGIEYAVVGALAAGAYGSSRSTADADICVALAPEDGSRVAALLDALAARGFRFHREALLRKASQGRSFLFTWLGAVRMDVLLTRPGSEWEDALRWRREGHVDGTSFWIAAPEDVIALKLAAGREQDLDAVREVLEHQLASLDLDRLRAQVARMARCDAALPGRLEACVEQARATRELAARLSDDELPPLPPPPR